MREQMKLLLARSHLTEILLKISKQLPTLPMNFNMSIPKLLYIALFIFLASRFASIANAATKTPSPVPSQNEVATSDADIEKVQKIKDIVASKVKELKLVEKRGIIATLKDVSNM